MIMDIPDAGKMRRLKIGLEYPDIAGTSTIPLSMREQGWPGAGVTWYVGIERVFDGKWYSTEEATLFSTCQRHCITRKEFPSLTEVLSSGKIP